MTNDFIFDKKLGRNGIQNTIVLSAFLDLFYTRAIYFSNGIALSKYVNFGHSNWDNYNQDNDFMSDIANNNGLESEPEDFNQPGINLDDSNKLYYGIYN